MEERSIATHCGGELTIGGGPPIDGVLHCWFYVGKEGRLLRHGGGAPYGFMFGHLEGRQLAEALRAREYQTIRIFTGKLVVTHTESIAYLWFYGWGASAPECCCRLFEGSVYAAADAIGEACEEADDWRAADVWKEVA
jgi:hypothetical protein